MVRKRMFVWLKRMLRMRTQGIPKPRFDFIWFRWMFIDYRFCVHKFFGSQLSTQMNHLLLTCTKRNFYFWRQTDAPRGVVFRIKIVTMQSIFGHWLTPIIITAANICHSCTPAEEPACDFSLSPFFCPSYSDNLFPLPVDFASSDKVVIMWS